MNCRVVVEAAVPVYDVETPDEAIRIGISKTGGMLNPELNYVEIEMADRTSPSGEELPPAFIAADEALVALELEMTVFNVEREEHASRIARKEIGQRLENIPLEVIEVVAIDEESEESEESEETAETAETTTESDETGASVLDEELDEEFHDETDTERSDSGTAPDEEVLPEFEELIDE